MDDELYHYGIKGMKWGVRRTAEQLGHVTKKAVKKVGEKAVEGARKKAEERKVKSEAKKYKKRKVKDMTDAEIQQRIKRLELEQRYTDLMKSTKPQKSRGQKFVEDVLYKSGDNIAGQFTTYVLGTGVNKAFGSMFNDPRIVNPKKGQKDK